MSKGSQLKSANIPTYIIGKNNNTRTMQAESFKFASVSFDHGFQIAIPPRSPASVLEPIGMPSDGILHLRSKQGNCDKFKG